MALILGLSACKKDKTGITYPQSDIFGVNILSAEVGDTFMPYQEYSLSAELEEDAKLKVVITQTSNNDPIYNA